MSLTKEMWKNPEFRAKMKAASERAKLTPRDKFQDLDPNAVDGEGNQLRPSYIAIPPGPKPMLNIKSLEKSVESFCKEAKENGWIDQEPTKKKPPKINTEFNNGPLTFTKEKLEEWQERQKDDTEDTSINIVN